MKHRGYEAVVAFNADDRVLHGRLLCTQDVVSFEADNVSEVESAFHEAVDDYLEQCAVSRRDAALQPDLGITPKCTNASRIRRSS